MTHRQFLAWEYWTSDDMNRPSRADHYVMALTATLKQVNCTTRGRKFDVNDERLKFRTGPARRTQPADFAKACVLGAFPDEIVTRRTITRAEAVEQGLIPDGG